MTYITILDSSGIDVAISRKGHLYMIKPILWRVVMNKERRIQDGQRLCRYRHTLRLSLYIRLLLKQIIRSRKNEERGEGSIHKEYS